MCSGEPWPFSAAWASSISAIEAAPAEIAIVIAATGNVCTSWRIGISGSRAVIWWTIRPSSRATPDSSGANAIRSSMRWVWSSEAPKKAAAHPVPASRIAAQSRGASGSCGGESSKVSSDSSRARPPMPQTIQNSGRHACALAWMPPMNGPSATAPKIPTFMTIAVVGSRLVGQPSTSAGAAAISIMLVNRPWMMWPAMNSPGVHAVALRTEPSVNIAA